MYAAGQPILWPAPPEWSNGVAETLIWLTDAPQASGTGAQQMRALRGAPRRIFAFDTRDYLDDRRIVDAILFDVGVKQVQLPIAPDVQWLTAPLAAGITVIPCNTAGFDFTVGGSVALWLDAMHCELGVVAAIAADSITLTVATASAYPLGTRLYPVRKARVAEAPQIAWGSDEIIGTQASIAIDEPCDWPAAWPSPATYRGVPVLEWRGEESEDPTDQYTRMSGAVDEDVGPVYYYDLPSMPFRVQSQAFKLYGRADHTRFRSLLYALNGRAGQMWVPSWQNDIRMIAAIASDATALQVGPCLYTLFGRKQVNRRDIRIELQDGTVFYRRITASAQTAGGETLTLDSALGVAVDPSQVRQINWLSMSALATDSVTISHATDADGVASALLHWQAVKSNV